MSAFLQPLSVVLAMVAVGTFLMSGYLLGASARGWRDAPIWLRQILHLVAVFWLVAAFVAMRHPAAVITPVTVFFAAAFALGGFAVLAWVIKHRPARAHRRGGR
ncbi:hypothetical protein B7G68_15170 [Caulobacter segnis]|uniref:DUF3325 domain-containing protein n=2 Tax=Caulobacter segnis TaxID=88688 RepID=D5VLN2_CAUST|nr:hypothetical protein [Caulobacter segnis]ADG11405.1 hypothetical protein Cseg_2961 [Caulobacter segnis ATCC 21756]AVQ03072.1 hypothetical protein B7G68_15170 [Caulobacter segnis]